MKIYDIAFKDLKRIFTNIFSLVMMVGAPLLIAGLLYFAFGGLTKSGSKYTMPVTKVVIANLDQPGTQTNGFAAGEILVQFLQDPSLKDILAVSLSSDEMQARAAVDGGKAEVGMIIPSDFTTAAITPNHSTSIALYQDPTMTIGPSIVKDLVSHFMDAFSGSKIAAQTATNGLSSRGIKAGENFTAQVTQIYANWQQTNGHDENSAVPRLAVVSPSGETQASPEKTVPIELIMAGMIIFFVFFIGANGAESLIREDEEGTLKRMFTTPTSRVSILAGKLVAIVVSLGIQIVLLLAASSLLFRIHWGQPTTVILVSFSLVIAAAGFGILLMSLIKNSRQTGPVMGGVLTLLGLLGGMFTVAIPNLPSSVDKVTLITPHGWAMQGWKLAIAGSNPIQAFVPVIVLLVMGITFFGVGVALFQKRFA